MTREIEVRRDIFAEQSGFHAGDVLISYTATGKAAVTNIVITDPTNNVFELFVDGECIKAYTTDGKMLSVNGSKDNPIVEMRPGQKLEIKPTADAGTEVLRISITSYERISW